MTRRLIAVSCAFALLLTLGCGNKGPLYLPKKTAEPAAETGARPPE